MQHESLCGWYLSLGMRFAVIQIVAFVSGWHAYNGSQFAGFEGEEWTRRLGNFSSKLGLESPALGSLTLQAHLLPVVSQLR